MCGLTGYIDFENASADGVLEKMTASLHHRGPDDDGYVIRQLKGTKIGLGFRRLSVIDLSYAGHQPMVNEENGDIILLNGEIYNYRELREELIQNGHQFKSQTDTEVALKAFRQWGDDFVKKFSGMFAIVIYSPSTNKLHLFRDRPGVKPLYYYWDGKLFLFASELKAFHQHPGFKKKINFDALRLYFHHGYIPSPYCIFRNTHKLQPGSHLEINLLNKKFRKHKYWSIIDVFNKPKIEISFEEASAELEKILVSSFNLRMIADVPVGVFLSGGYDSSCVTALLQHQLSAKLKTFTISFENQAFDEGPYAQAVANHLGTDHQEYRCTDKDAIDLVNMLPDVYDEPIADGGAIPNILVSILAREKVKVVLSADGGDEIFAGYTKHFYAKQQYERYFGYPYLVRRIMAKGIDVVNRFRNWPLYRVDRLSRLQSFLEAKDASTLFERTNQIFTDYEINLMLKRRTKNVYNSFMNDHLLNKNNDEVDRVIAVDFLTYLADDILPKVDRASSYASIEAREPFLDHRIIEFAAALPSHYKLNDGNGKYIIKEIVHKYIPKKIMDRPKMGFGLPINIWGMTSLKPLFDECFDPIFLRKQGLFNVSKVSELYNHYQSGNLLSFDRMYEVFIFQQWYKKWMM